MSHNLGDISAVSSDITTAGFLNCMRARRGIALPDKTVGQWEGKQVLLLLLCHSRCSLLLLCRPCKGSQLDSLQMMRRVFARFDGRNVTGGNRWLIIQMSISHAISHLLD